MINPNPFKNILLNYPKIMYLVETFHYHRLWTDELFKKETSVVDYNDVFLYKKNYDFFCKKIKEKIHDSSLCTS